MTDRSENYEDTLRQWDEDFDNLPTRQGALPDGEYQAEITAARVERTDWGNLQFVLEFQALTGTENGGKVWKKVRLDHDVAETRVIQQGIVKQDLMTLGFIFVNDETKQHECSVQLHDLPNITPQIVGKTVKIKVSRYTYTGNDGTTKTGINVYLNKLLDVAGGLESGAIDVPPVEGALAPDGDYPW